MVGNNVTLLAKYTICSEWNKTIQWSLKKKPFVTKHNTKRKVYKIQMYILFKTRDAGNHQGLEGPIWPFSLRATHFCILGLCNLLPFHFSFTTWIAKPPKYRLVWFVPQLDINGIISKCSFTKHAFQIHSRCLAL